MRISLHAPRTGSDVRRQPLRRILGISIHAPRTGSDIAVDGKKYATGEFQSTLPARGATRIYAHLTEKKEISIHAPRTGSDKALFVLRQNGVISIHAPRTGSDPTGTQ